MSRKTAPAPAPSKATQAPAPPAKTAAEQPKTLATTAQGGPATKAVPPVTPTMADLLLADAGAGQETMGREDFAIPRISILQSLSPQLDKTDAAYIKGAEAGDIYDNVTNAVYKGETGIPVVLVAYRRTMLEWWPRGSSKGKGFVADHGLDQSQMARTTKNDKGAFITPEGTEIVNTAEYYAFILNDRGGADRVVLSMAKSQLKYSKRLNTMINQYQVQRPDGKGTFNPAMFYRIYMMKTMPEKNEKGNWFSWMVEPGMDLLKLPDGEKLYLEARAFRESVAEGKVKVSQGEGEDLPTEHEAF